MAEEPGADAFFTIARDHISRATGSGSDVRWAGESVFVSGLTCETQAARQANCN